jgi:hypothetical protein
MQITGTGDISRPDAIVVYQGRCQNSNALGAGRQVSCYASAYEVGCSLFQAFKLEDVRNADMATSRTAQNLRFFGNYPNERHKLWRCGGQEPPFCATLNPSPARHLKGSYGNSHPRPS